MAAYALLTYVARGDVAAALPIVKWLSQQRNAQGGFSSTQDTCVALHALSQYASLAHTGAVDRMVTLASTKLDLDEVILLHENNTDVLQSVEIPSLPTGLFVFVDAMGDGCVLVQVRHLVHLLQVCHVVHPATGVLFSATACWHKCVILFIACWYRCVM